jgi:hypothetical protein
MQHVQAALCRATPCGAPLWQAAAAHRGRGKRREQGTEEKCRLKFLSALPSHQIDSFRLSPMSIPLAR